MSVVICSPSPVLERWKDFAWEDQWKEVPAHLTEALGQLQHLPEVGPALRALLQSPLALSQQLSKSWHPRWPHRRAKRAQWGRFHVWKVSLRPKPSIYRRVAFLLHPPTSWVPSKFFWTLSRFPASPCKQLWGRCLFLQSIIFILQ